VSLFKTLPAKHEKKKMRRGRGESAADIGCDSAAPVVQPQQQKAPPSLALAVTI
jgi:hypothetical protein